MKSVGTRTTLPRGPPLSRRGPSDRGFGAEHLLPPPSASEGTGSSVDRGGSCSMATDRPRLAGADSTTAAASNLERVPSASDRPEGSGPARREAPRAPGAVGVDVCGNPASYRGEKVAEGKAPGKARERSSTRAGGRTPPEILPVSGKLEQNNSAVVRPSAFKPVVPKSFHSMQNLVGHAGGGGGVGGRTAVGAAGSDAPQSLSEQDSPERERTGANGGQGGMSDSGRNSLTSLPTYAGPGSAYGRPTALGPLSNGLSASDSGRSSSGKSSSSYHRLCHLGDTPAAVRPSPSSDDVIQDLEDRLWEKEQEVLHMRRNLDQSEAAIAQVFDEKQRVWEHEMEELRQNYAGRLQQVSRRAQRSQQALQAQVARLQQDKGRLQEEIGALLAQRDKLERMCLDYRKEQADLLPRLEETKWEVCQKAGEISLLKQQLRDSQNEVTQRAGDMVALRSRLKELNAQLRQREEAMLGLKDSYSSKSLLRDRLVVFEAEVLGLKRALGELSYAGERATGGPGGCSGSGGGGSLPLQSDEAKAQRREAGELQQQLERLQGELRLERQQRELQALTFAQERHTWQDEKQRVLKYQARLQLSYVETLQRNQALEERVGQLGAKLVTSAGSPKAPVCFNDVSGILGNLVPHHCTLAAVTKNDH
uniref:Leucine zipper tumor suppressor 3 n=1 Tax=Electrophorus electricus TaxID=8005 RepID=A0AAY5F3H7_ELEEL